MKDHFNLHNKEPNKLHVITETLPYICVDFQVHPIKDVIVPITPSIHYAAESENNFRRNLLKETIMQFPILLQRKQISAVRCMST